MQKFLGLHRRLTGALQFEESDRAAFASNGEAVVEQLARRTRAINLFAAQDF